MTADAELLQSAVSEVARLLRADGAMIYLVDEATGQLRFAHDAGITDPEARRLIHDLTLPVGVGMFGTAVASRRMTVTDDYPADQRFTHSEVADRIVTAARMRSMAVAPLLANGRPIGAMGAYASRPAAFSEPQIALLRALADHAAAAIANQRLVAQLAASEERYRNLVEGSPDVVWATDHRGRLVFLSETVEQLTGRRADELLGQHWSSVIAEDRESFQRRWDESKQQGDEERRVRFRIQRADGTPRTVELRGRERVIDGIGAGAHGSIRDISELASLEDDLRAQAQELEHRVETQQTLHAITARITAIRDPDEVLQQVVDAAKRLLVSDGAHLTLLDPGEPILRPHVIAGGVDEERRAWLAGQEFPIGGGMNGLAARDGVPVWTNDYLVDPRIPHTEDDQQVARHMGLGAMAVAPLRAPEGAIFGTLAVSYVDPREITPDEIELLQGLADVGAIAIANARLEASLRQQTEELSHLVDAQRTLAEIAAEMSSIRDPVGVLRRTVAAARRLLGGDHAVINLESGTAQAFASEDLAELIDPGAIPVGVGLAGTAIAQRRVLWTGDYLAESAFVHSDEADAWIRERGYRSQISAPLHQEEGPMGALTVYAKAGAAFDEDDADLLDALAGHAAIVQTNARLYAEAQQAAEELAHLVEAQRSLASIAAQISGIRDPAAVLQRTVDEARRLLNADLAQINPLDAAAGRLEWSVAYSPADQELDDVVVTPGHGVSGTALAEGRVVRTGDYLADQAFAHSPELDEYVARRGMASLMAAPLVAGDQPIGTLTVQARRTDVFNDDDAELLGVLAAQAAVAITNARLLEQMQGSERRYRHLVEHSPDLVWSVDAAGIFTYLGEALERMTGMQPQDLVGHHWGEIVTEESMPVAQRAWAAVQERPDEEIQLRVVLRRSGGGGLPTEVNMVATTVNGRFAGAQGSIRDIHERERLEEDLRRQAAAIALMARELHDSVTQALFSMGLTARTLEMLLDRDPEAARGKLAELRELQKDALAEMRTLIFELRPQGLETDGLAQALRNHAAAVQGRTGLAVAVEIDVNERLPLHAEEALYRVAQEALHNVVKHANAQNARISLRHVGRELRLTVEDDGIGFDPGAVPSGHLGVVGMGQRVERIGGRLDITVRPGGGTRVRATLPLASLAAAGARQIDASAE
jgi:PAS domain S-box-containing protein